MRAARIARLAPEWLLTYAGVIMLVSVLVNLATGFAQSTHSLTIPSMRDSLHISYTQAGILVTVAGAVRMGSSLAAGTLAPRYGSRAMIGVSTLVSGASMLLLGYAPNFFLALAASALMGLSTGAALTPMMGLLAPWFQMRNRGLAAGLAAAGGSVAFIIAGVLVPWFVNQSPDDGWRHSWRLFGVISLAIGVLSLVFLRDRPKVSSTARLLGAPPTEYRGAWPLAVYKNPQVWLVTYLAFCSGVANGVFSTFFGAYLSEENNVSLAVAGWLLVMIGVLGVASGVLWGRVSDQWSRGRAFLVSFLIQGVAFALFWLTPVMVALVLASVLLGLTIRAAYTLCAASSGDHVPAQFAAAAFALMSVGAGLGSTASPVIAGAIADTVGIGWAFTLSIGASFMGVAGAAFLRNPGTTRAPEPVTARPET
jgi:MFS family permease